MIMTDTLVKEMREHDNTTGWPKDVSHTNFSKKIVLKIANEIRFLRKVKV